MRLSDFATVRDLMQKRSALCLQRDNIEADQGRGILGVTIQGVYQDEELVDRIRPAVLDTLANRIAAIDDKLAALGVDPSK